ncbi:MAG: hypothetical protein AAFW83_11865 [Pseudomonadota bacterium]
MRIPQRLDFDDAVWVIRALKPHQSFETIDREIAFGRVLRREVLSRLLRPAFDISAMDGFAVR